MTNILIIGYGQIGKSIERLYDNKFNDYIKEDANIIYNVYTVDSYMSEGTNIPSTDTDIDIMHICIPHTHQFVEDVIGYISEHNPALTIIHSTVPVYTTKDIVDATNENVVHSPVMGKHPNLTESLLTFTKIIGGYNNDAVTNAETHLWDLGITSIIYKNAEESEAAKLLDTTYYGWNVLYMKYVNKFCEERGLDFENVYTTTNNVYNSGYTEMGVTNVTRPILKYQPGKIGGHCVRPNFELLKKDFYPAKVAIEMDDSEETQ